MPPPLPINFIGHFDVAAKGKFLWEILCQLRNMGIGRYITKTEWNLKWPNEPSYLLILKARPEMDRWQHKGNLWAEWTFRGHNLGVYEFSEDLNRSDWKLISKNEEQNYLKNTNQMKPIEISKTVVIPPLQKHILQRQLAKKGIKWTEAHERIPTELCIDPQFEFLRPLIRFVDSSKIGTSIYDEVNPETYLDLYGNMLPFKVEAWMLGPAKKSFHFMPTPKSEE